VLLVLAALQGCAGTVPPGAANVAPPGPVAAGLSAARLARLDDYLARATGPAGYLGAVALVARGGRPLLWQAWGSRDLARSEAMSRDAIFRIYSMSKTVASVAVLMLMEEGRLALDDPVALYLPAFAGVRVMVGGSADAPLLRAPLRPPTVRHLLTHTAGLATGGPGLQEATKLMERAAPAAASDLAGFAARVAEVPLGADPGTRFDYDGVNTELLGRIVEVVSGLPFEAFLQQRILGPLGMVDTGFAVPAAQRHRIADLSAMGPDGRLVRGPGRSAASPGEPLNAYPSGAGGLYSTAPDVLRLGRMLLGGGTLDGTRLLGRKTVDLMMCNHLAPAVLATARLAPGEGFGLGGSVVIDTAQRGRLSSVGAFGWSGAASTYYTVDPAEDLVAILLLQHLPRDDAAGELPRLQNRFFNLVYQALDP